MGLYERLPYTNFHELNLDKIMAAVNAIPDLIKEEVTAQVAEAVSGVVDTAKIADYAVTTAKIADGAVTTAKFADKAVTNNKLNIGFTQNTGASASVPSATYTQLYETAALSAGSYLVMWQVRYQANSDGYRQGFLSLDGNSAVSGAGGALATMAPTASGQCTAQGTCLVRNVAEGQTFKVIARQNSGQAITASAMIQYAKIA